MQPLIAGCAVMALFLIASLAQGAYPPVRPHEEAEQDESCPKHP